RPTEAWYTVYGDGPQIFTGAVTDDLDAMKQVIGNSEWKNLHGKLMEYVDNYRQIIVRATSTFQLF
ncbi:MAG: hypothetical protein ACE5G8_15155, partial [Anaerolineae bacterium]